VFLTVGGTYTEDVVDEQLAGAVHVFFVRSPVAHARIVSVDATAALAAPGVVAVFTADDLTELPEVAPVMPEMNQLMAQPLPAKGDVRFVGEPVAAVVVDHPYRGEDAVELVEVEYDPLLAVVSTVAAVTDEALLCTEAGTNTVVTYGDIGELEALFEDCDVVVSQVIENQRIAPAPMEPRGAAAVWGDDNRLIGPKRLLTTLGSAPRPATSQRIPSCRAPLLPRSLLPRFRRDALLP
jgi:carbon-monoxide dehydrogenase large subunit